MACEEIREDAQAYLDNELSPARRVVVEEHIHNCPQCQEVVRELESISAALGAWSDARISRQFEFDLEFKLANEPVPEEKPSKARPRLQVEFVDRPIEKAPKVSALTWVLTGWRPVAATAAMMLVTVAILTMYTPDRTVRPANRRNGGNVLAALTAAGGTGEMADASIFAGIVAKRAIGEATLDSTRVAQSDVVYSFLASVDSQTDKNTGRKLINLLARATGDQIHTRRPTAAVGLSNPLSLFFGAPAYAAEITTDPLVVARSYELQGRLKEALIRYGGLTGGSEAGRAQLAIGALKLRMGELTAAETTLTGVASHGDPVVSTMAGELLQEIRVSREAARKLAKARQGSLASGQDWFEVALLEVAAYDFRDASSSFMKAANASGVDEDFARQARFRSAWCQVETGQIGTGIYGFKNLASASTTPDEIAYVSGIEEAVGLARIGKYKESVAACNMLLKNPAPSAALEALCLFQKGVVELRNLDDSNAAIDSLSRAASSGQGNLSYAAQVLLQNSSR